MDQEITLTREFALSAPADLPADAPIPVTIATDTPVARGFGVQEVLDCSAEGVDLSRAPLSLIVGHDASALAIGVVEELRAEGNRVTGLARFATSEEAQQVRSDVIAGIHRYVSVGYALLDEGTLVDGNFKFRWKPLEVSIVPVPADPAAGFFRSLSGVISMQQNQQQTRDEITALCKRHGLAQLAAGMIDRNIGVDAARDEIMEALTRRDALSGGHLNVRGGGATSAAAIERERILNTLVARLGGRPQGEVITSVDCVGLAVRALQLAGHQVGDGDSRDAILQRALHTTSDFSHLLNSAVGRVLSDAFEEAPAALKQVARQSNVPDFREKTTVRLGAASSLEKVNEHGEFKYGTIQDAGNSWRVFTYGRIIGITRQALINDDLGGFSSLLTKFGQAAARREADELVAVLTSPPQVDGADLFSIARNSLITDELAVGAIGTAVSALRVQRDLDGGLLNSEPAYLVVPAALEMVARQITSILTPLQPSDVQPYKLTVIVEPRLDAISTTAWYLASRTQASLEYGYLEGAEGVQTFQRDGFEVDGLEIKARLDFGCGWVAPVGWVKSTGAGA